MLKKIIFFFITIVYIVMFSGCDNSNLNKYPYLKKMEVNNLWSYSNGKSQIIAFIDTGLSAEAKKLYKNRIVHPYNATDNSSNINDTIGHGTILTSIACGDGQEDIWGIAPKAKIMPIKAINDDGSVNSETLIRAINYAIEKNATIINLSLGTHVENNGVKNIILKALHKNITIVASSGDYGEKDLLFPANMPGVISVEALNEDGTTWDFSNTSKQATSTFPGVNIYSLYKDNKIKRVSGTSYSAALASGYISLLRDYMQQKNIKISNDKIIRQMKLINNSNASSINYLTPIKSLNK